MSDLNIAIEISNGRGKAAEQAYTQRGLIYMLQDNEDKALQDFKVSSLFLFFRFEIKCRLLRH